MSKVSQKEHSQTCNLCKKRKKKPCFARMFPTQINDQWMRLCKDCWEVTVLAVLDPISLKCTIVETPGAKLVKRVYVFKDKIILSPGDKGARLTVPTKSFTRLKGARLNDILNVRALGDGIGLNWPALDEDLLVDKMYQAARNKFEFNRESNENDNKI